MRTPITRKGPGLVTTMMKAAVAMQSLTACNATGHTIRAAERSWATTDIAIPVREESIGRELKTPACAGVFLSVSVQRLASYSQNLQGGKSRL